MTATPTALISALEGQDIRVRILDFDLVDAVMDANGPNAWHAIRARLGAVEQTVEVSGYYDGE